MRRASLLIALLTLASASMPRAVLAQCECWTMYVEGTTLRARLTPNVEVPTLAGFVIDRAHPELCGSSFPERITPSPLAFGELHTIELGTASSQLSARYTMKTVHVDGREGSPVDVCDFPVECLGLVPPVLEAPGPLGFFLGHGILSGSAEAYRLRLDPCIEGCGYLCSNAVHAFGALLQEDLAAVVASGAPHLFWGKHVYSSDYCYTLISLAAPATCTVAVESRSWSALKGWFD